MELSFVYGGVGVDDTVIFVNALRGNFPNPFNPSAAGRCPTTTIKFCIKEDNNVKIEIFNIKGEIVRTLVNDRFAAGEHKVVWNGIDNNGGKVASGIYFYRLQTEDFSRVRKMMLLK